MSLITAEQTGALFAIALNDREYMLKVIFDEHLL
jgi:hypothetical protein